MVVMVVMVSGGGCGCGGHSSGWMSGRMVMVRRRGRIRDGRIVATDTNTAATATAAKSRSCSSGADDRAGMDRRYADANNTIGQRLLMDLVMVLVVGRVMWHGTCAAIAGQSNAGG